MRHCQTTAHSLLTALTVIAAWCLLVAPAPALAKATTSELPYVTVDALGDGVSLRGQWRFQPGDNLDWAAPGADDNHWRSVDMPQRWPRGGYPEHQHLAWYRLTLQLDPHIAGVNQAPILAVRMGKVLSAYELYAGGQLVGGAGSLPPLGEFDYDRQRVLVIPPAAINKDGTLVLALRVWGGSDALVDAWGAGPVSGVFMLGDYRRLMLQGMVSEVPGLLFCALIFAFGLYHLYLFARNRNLETYLWFGLMATNIAIYGVMLTQWKYLLPISFLAMKKIEFGAIYLFPALGIQMVWSLLQLPIGRWLRAYQWSFLAAAVLVVLVPGHAIHFHTLIWWQLWTLPIIAFAPWVIFRESRAGNPEAKTILLGTIIFLATGVNDLLIDLAHIETSRLAPLGFVAILIAMAVSMADRFTSMYSTLETEVAERTAELSAVNRRLAEAARVDHLTGLLNRRGFTEEAETEIRRMFRTGKSFSLVLADVDNFKQFNDQYGHVCGDHVLKRVAALLEERTRDVDRVARWGGEEFIMLLPETEIDGAAILAEKLRDAVAANLFEFDNLRLSLTMTFGIAAFRKGESLDACIARADTALYHGKEGGRNKVMIGNYKGLSLVN
ncbi:diguanylate cyclase [Seongchinamella unica]|uniref:diguanylate cyclase n=1 Tax=Seongchinamella unica TaxID=2547392 RepID=A0A4R5LQL4_9GAMM|nr:diguanylate cyclase [Seongchinamella unica]TDG12857.1 diguanylate cyclase [Seongchinamella unica]